MIGCASRAALAAGWRALDDLAGRVDVVEADAAISRQARARCRGARRCSTSSRRTGPRACHSPAREPSASMMRWGELARGCDHGRPPRAARAAPRSGRSPPKRWEGAELPVVKSAVGDEDGGDAVGTSARGPARRSSPAPPTNHEHAAIAEVAERAEGESTATEGIETPFSDPRLLADAATGGGPAEAAVEDRDGRALDQRQLEGGEPRPGLDSASTKIIESSPR